MANDWYSLYTWAMDRQQQLERDASRRRLPKLAKSHGEGEDRVLPLSPVLTLPVRRGVEPASHEEVQDKPA
jgi:hypothetical protein